MCGYVCSVTHLSPTLCDLMDYSALGSSVHGIFQARILKYVPFPSPGDLPNSGIKLVSLTSPALAAGFFTASTTDLGAVEIQWEKDQQRGKCYK